MNVAFLIAKRYFSSKNKRNIISIISNISMIGVAIGTMALIIVLSVFNGLEDLVRAIYSRSDPNLEVMPAKGKAFTLTPGLLQTIEKQDGVALVTEVIEDNVLMRYDDRQMVIKLKGVSANYFKQNQVDSAIVEGRYELENHGTQYALVGYGVKQRLSIDLANRFTPLVLLYPKNRKKISLDPTEAFNDARLMCGGVFSLERVYDEQYVFVPVTFAARLMDYGQRRTSLEIKLKEDENISKVQRRLQRKLGPDYRVLSSDEQHLSLLRAVKVEKAFVFVTFTFILLIASLNIFFSLSMLVIDKKKDVAILQAMGASQNVIRNIFLSEGAIVAFTGALTGLVLGVAVCWAQKSFGLVSMGAVSGGSDQAYPVNMLWSDVLLTTLAIIVITLLVSIRPAQQAAALEIRDNL